MKKNKRVLLLAPPFMGLQKDIITSLETMGYHVTWIEDFQVAGNPYNKASDSREAKTVEEYNKEVNAFWYKRFSEFKGLPVFDYFFAIDGMMVSPMFFQLLREHNPKIKTVLYLYDKVEGFYEIDGFFQYYDRVFTFDKSDSVKYGIVHLPYYWVPSSDDNIDLYDIFGMASYKEGERYEVFKRIRKIAIDAGLRENIHLWHSPVKNRFKYRLEYVVKRLLGRTMLSLTSMNDALFTDKKMPPEDFRHSIQQSKVVIDTNNDNQDGLTARFMWALSAGKKIIMTNTSVKDYPFYSTEQILILKDNYDHVVDFIKSPFEMKPEVKETICQYRIDNWLKTLLS